MYQFKLRVHLQTYESYTHEFNRKQKCPHTLDRSQLLTFYLKPSYVFQVFKGVDYSLKYQFKWKQTCKTNQILDVVALRTGMISVSVIVIHTENNFKIPCKINSSKRLYQHF